MDCFAFSVVGLQERKCYKYFKPSPNKPLDGGITSSHNARKEITAFRGKVLGNKLNKLFMSEKKWI